MTNADESCRCCGGAVLLILMVCIGSCARACEKSENRRIKEDYSSPTSEMGRFVPSSDPSGPFGSFGGGINARGFVVRNGVGYLTLDDGDVIKMKRVGDGEYSGLNYRAVQTPNGYRISRHGRR